MNIILLGPQGSGKGTQAQLLAQKYKLNHFEAGKILRSVAKDSHNQYCQAIKDSMNTGSLVPDEFVRLIAWDFINKKDRNKGFIFDGYPRALSQYSHLKDMLMKFGKRLDAVINIEITAPETIRRLSSRRVCQKCGLSYNLLTNPPPNGKCTCGGELYQRADDQPQAIEKRLEIYRSTTHLVFEAAKKEGIGKEVNGEQSIETIHQQIVEILKPFV